jgi:hypothetical protein
MDRPSTPVDCKQKKPHPARERGMGRDTDLAFPRHPAKTTEEVVCSG